MRYLLLTLLISFTANAVTPLKTTPPRESILATTEITIRKYFEDSDAFEIVINTQLGVGPNYATPEDLKAALGLPGTLADFKKKTLRNLGEIYVLRKELVLLWPVELKIRAKHKR